MSPSSLIFLLFLSFFSFLSLTHQQTCNLPQQQREPCPTFIGSKGGKINIIESGPGDASDPKTTCIQKGCCWSDATSSCYKSLPIIQYSVTKSHLDHPSHHTHHTPARVGVQDFQAVLSKTTDKTVYGKDISPLNFVSTFVTPKVLRVKVVDPNSKRWEVPGIVSVPSGKRSSEQDNDYTLSYTSSPFGFAVTRKSNQEVIFNTTGFSFVFEDQYIELTTTIGSQGGVHLYGLGERVSRFKLNNTVSDPPLTYTMFARDQGTPVDDGHLPGKNLYGSHPFYLEMRTPTDGSGTHAHGVFLLNSNAIDVTLSGNQLTYRIVGGVIDFFFLLGPTPEEVIQQYHDLIGHADMPPYWSLGWHQCKWGYHTIEDTEAVVANYSKAGIPLDVMWNDIDWMLDYEDFVFDPVRFPPVKMQQFLATLHKNNQHYMMITDAGVAMKDGYVGYKTGMEMNVFVKEPKYPTKPLVGKVWPGYAVFPDWMHPNSTSYWIKMMTLLYTLGAPFDGVWLDMNEVSNFCDGECNNPDLPFAVPYIPGGTVLDTKTIRMDSRHYNTIEYNVHSLNGFWETRATNQMLRQVRGKRPFIISRSTFPGHGRYGGHWLGDNSVTWDDMAYSISGVLSFQMFGVPMVGADICGFTGEPNEELCLRWMELGTLYPFSRNHHNINSGSQEPYVFGPQVRNASIDAISLKYQLLPYYYTLLSYVYKNGGTVVRPVFFEFPQDTTLFDIDGQFMIGHGLLVSPVLAPNVTTVKAYFPSAQWYDFYTGNLVTRTSGYLVVPAPPGRIPLHARGGYITPTQPPRGSKTALESRTKPYSLLVALDANGHAEGWMYLDDGDSLDTVKNGQYLELGFKCSNQVITSSILFAGKYSPPQVFGEVKVFGVNKSTITTVLVNQIPVKTFTLASNGVLTIYGLSLSPGSPFIISWK